MTIGFLGSGTPETQGLWVTAFTLRLGNFQTEEALWSSPFSPYRI
jgi:hypothetical protein